MANSKAAGPARRTQSNKRTSPQIQHSTRERASKHTQKTNRVDSRVTVSAAGLFKNKGSTTISHGHSKNQQIRGRHEYEEHETIAKFTGTSCFQSIISLYVKVMLITSLTSTETLEDSRDAIHSRMNKSFAQIRSSFVSRIAEQKSSDEVFLESMTQTANPPTAPLSSERIETTYAREGGHVIEMVIVGERVDQFRKLIAKEQAKLAGYWKEWEALEMKFDELGKEVLGGRGGNKRGDESDFRREMKLIDTEIEAKKADFMEAIEGISVDATKKMKASEKVCEGWTQLLSL